MIEPRLDEASALVVGLGAAGTVAAAYLAASGVGRLGLADGGVVARDDVQRAILHFTPDIGVGKAPSAAAKLGFINPELVLDTYPVRVDALNAPAIVVGHDLVLDASNDPETALALNDACWGDGIALVSVAVAGLSAVVQAVLPEVSPCLRCSGEGVRPTASADRLGAVAGAAGSLAALEALKLLAGRGSAVAHSAAHLDANGFALEHVERVRDGSCRTCGAVTL